jgi:hypothetical protein
MRADERAGASGITMKTAKSAGRIIGVLFLLQFIGSLLVNFVIMDPVFAAPGFLVNAAEHPLLVGTSVVLGLVASVMSVGIAITAYPVFRRYSPGMALWFVALAVVTFVLNAVENIHVMSMLTLSQAYAKASAADHDLFQALRGVVASARNWAHYIGLIGGGSSLLVFYSVLFRFTLVPQALAACGIGAVALQITAVAMPLFGSDIVFPMLLPLAVMQLVLIGWLLAKGLAGSEAARQ